ncbi:MBL fold metallo-hydrolase [Bacteroidota bacterium]
MQKILIILIVAFLNVSFSVAQTTINKNENINTEAYIFNDKSYEIKDIQTKELESSVKIYFLGNCGYLISGGGKNIIIDAPHYNQRFPDNSTPQDVYEKMLNKEEPFRKIDLLLVSHAHHDHFSAEMGFELLLKHPEAKMIANEHTISLEKERQPEAYEKIKHQIISKTPEWGDIEEVNVNGCSIKLYLVKHVPGSDLNREFIVTQFLIETEGLNMLHMGDMYIPPNMEYFEKFGLEKLNIDIAFFDNWNYNDGKVLMEEYIKPKFFVMMHNKYKEVGKYFNSLIKIYPNTTIFLEAMESKIFLKTKNN